MTSIERVVTIAYHELASFDPNLSNESLVDRVAKAFGPQGLGILAVTDIPNFLEQRRALLPLARQVPQLPDLVETCVDPKSLFSTGWSHGKEQLAPGKPDLAKGSFYGNPLVNNLVDALTQRSGGQQQQYYQAQAELHPEFYAPNLWPTKSLPALECAFMELGQTIHDTGCLLAQVCDAVCRQQGVTTNFAALLSKSMNAKGRLLHYFDVSSQEESESPDLWCGWHNDHGSLTGLVPAMYLDEQGREIPCPDDQAGLYIQSRSGDIVRIDMPGGACGFQIGETSQIQSGGVLQATPHAVRPSKVRGVTRETFAVFLEPEFDDALDIPQGKTVADCQGCTDQLPPSVAPLSKRWKPGFTFGDFHVATVTAFLAD